MYIIAQSPTNDAPNAQQGITLTLESTGVFLGILVSVSALAGVAIKLISKMNSISATIVQVQITLKEQAEYTQKLRELDKDLALHLQEYINRKDVVQMVLGQLDEKINHTWSKTEKALEEQKKDTKEIQLFLQKQNNFKVRQ